MEFFNQLKHIYDHIGDEESGNIFRARLDYSLLGDESILLPMIRNFEDTVYSDERYLEAKEIVRKYGNGSYIYGAGKYARMLLSLCDDVIWKGILVTKPQCSSVGNVPVISLENFRHVYDGQYVFLPSKAYFGEMKEQLLETGVPQNRIIDITVFFDLTEGRQYFDLPYLKFGAAESFADCGCYDGTSIIGFLNRCNNEYKDIFCFEPDRNNLRKIEGFFRSQGITKYTLINKGVWDKEERLEFAANGSANSHIRGIIDKNESRIDTIEVISLDECLGDKDISFIKMDIEGAEYKALCGAEGIIRRCRPKLAICVYHKPEDIWEILGKILQLRDDYTLYLRHYSFGDTETVVYAV